MAELAGSLESRDSSSAVDSPLRCVMAKRDANGWNWRLATISYSLSAGAAPVTTKTWRTSGCRVPMNWSVSPRFSWATRPVAFSRLLLAAADQFKRRILYCDDRVEGHVLVLPAEEVPDRHHVVAVGKPRLLDVLRVVVDAAEAPLENARQFPLADLDNLRISPRRIHDEHVLLWRRRRGGDRVER